MAADLDLDADAQDQAEVFDETNITRDGDDIAHPDMARDVYDVTAADGDADDEDEDDVDDFDPDAVDEAELEMMLESDDGVDGPRAPEPDDADRVSLDDATIADYEEVTGEGDGGADRSASAGRRASIERRLDEDLEETFPASDPTSINPGAD
jgi:hypothetical protein